MWESLQRAAPQWDSEAVYQQDEEGRSLVTLYLLDPLNRNARKTVGRIIREFAKGSGWKLEKILLEDYFVFFVASKA
jgi:hypothetical protein